MQNVYVYSVNSRIVAQRHVSELREQLAAQSPDQRESGGETLNQLLKRVDRLEKKESELKRRLASTSRRTMGPSLIAACFITLIGLTLLGLVFGSKALGCLIAALILGSVLLILVFALRVSGQRPAGGKAETHSIDQAEDVELRDLSVSREPQAMILTGTLAVEHETPDTDYWLVGQCHEYSGGKKRTRGLSSRKVSPGVSFRMDFDKVEWNETMQAQIDDRIKDGMALRVTAHRAKPAELLKFTDAAGRDFQWLIELRPAVAIGGPEPRAQLFLRERNVAVENGYIEFTWNEQMSVGGHDLFLETQSAAVRLGTVATMNQTYQPITDPGAFRFTRRKLVGDGSGRFDFPRTIGGEVFVEEAGNKLVIHDQSAVPLFEVRAADSSSLSSAKLRLAKSGTMAEVIPFEERDENDDPVPFDLPSAPSGAEFISEHRIVTIPGVKLRTRVYQIGLSGEQVNREEPIVVKTPAASAYGIIVRCRVYPEGGPTGTERCLVDLVDAANGLTFHRFEVAATGKTLPESTVLPDHNERTQLTNTGTGISIDLVRNGAESWKLRCEVTLLPVRDQSPAAFQLRGFDL
ncbi:MAG: hypothetical protein AAF514_05740 [Verrucomicrobiota bacterium]